MLWIPLPNRLVSPVGFATENGRHTFGIGEKCKNRLLYLGQSQTNEYVLRSVMRPGIQGMSNEANIDHWAVSGGVCVCVCMHMCETPFTGLRVAPR